MFYKVKGNLLLSKDKFYKKIKGIDPTVQRKPQINFMRSIK